MKTAVIYARYSSDSQTEQSIEGQLRVCQDYAKANDILIVDTYIDRAMTGTNDLRPDFQRMIKDSGKRQRGRLSVARGTDREHGSRRRDRDARKTQASLRRARLLQP